MSTANNLARFTTGPNSVSGLVELANTIHSKSETFDKKISEAESKIAAKAAKVTEDIDRLTELPKNTRQPLRDKEIKRVRRDARDETDRDRWDTLRALKEADDQITAVESQFATPSHMLAREGLGSEERSRYYDQIEHSGPIELRERKFFLE